MMNLRTIRVSKNISQKQLANLTGFSVPTISRYETGKRKLSISNAKKIGKALNVDWILFFESNSK